MVFVTLGNQNFQFPRFLNKIEELLKSNTIKEEVITQIGHTSFESEHMKTFDFLSKEEFNNYIEKSSCIISHAGTGSLISSLKKGKKVIAAARLKRYNEHIDDHQVEILEAFSNRNLILGLKGDLSDFEDKWSAIGNFVPEKFISNNDRFNENLMKIIEGL